MDDQLMLLKKFPLLIPLNREFTAYGGYIKTESEEFRISLRVPNYPLLKDIQLCCSWRMGIILRDEEDEILKLTKSCTTVTAFLESLQNMLCRRMAHGGTEMSSLPTEIYLQVMMELAAVGPSCISKMSVAQGRAELKCTDTAGRVHYLQVSGIGSPNGLQIVSDLPPQALAALRAKGPSISTIYRAFCQHISSLQKFWLAMEELDDCCWVIDPEKPHRCDVSRRIIIGDNVSVQLHVNPWDPFSRPDIKFLGPERIIVTFRERILDNLEEWDNECTLLENLKLMLGLQTFPQKPDSSGEEQDTVMVRPGECFVCFSVRLEGSLPSEVCEGEHCGSIFHQDCLYQLLLTSPNHHRSFNRISGECPNCGTAISCQIPG